MSHDSALCLQFGSDLCSKVVTSRKATDEKPTRGGAVTSTHISSTQVRIQPPSKAEKVFANAKVC